MKKLLPLIILSMLISCAPQIDKNSAIDISDGWEYAEGSFHDTIKEAVNYKYKPTSSINDLSNKISHPKGVLWLKKTISLPKEYEEMNIGLLLGVGIYAEEAFWNNSNLGSIGVFPKTPDDFNFSSWNYYTFYTIPGSMITKENTIYRRIFINHEGTIQGSMLIGEASNLRKIKNFQDFYRIDVNQYIAIVLLIIALYHILIFLKRMSDPENLYYAFVCISFSVYSSNFFIQNFGFISSGILSYLTFQKIIFIAGFSTLFFLIKFLNSFLLRKPLKATKILWAVIFSSISLTFALIPNYKSFLLYSKQIFALTVVTGIIYTLVIFIMELFKRNKNSFILLIGLTPFFFCIMLDVILHTILGIENLVFFTGLGFPALLVAILFILANRFINYRNQAEELNISLEQKVQERTQKIEEANDEIQAAYEELEAINENLTETNRELEDAKMIMDRDMDMAINVQSSLFPKYAPKNNFWEVGFYFKPMAGVSGDGYDFYLDKGKFQGLSLFDVSGHGIASALVTMMAKTILFRAFSNGEDTSLEKIIENANDDLIEELKDVDNYLTGIVLRILDNNVIEYVNAGHPDMILKKANGNICSASNSKDIKGFYLGVSAMKSSYESVSLSLDKGDSLLLYSDCLTESTNSDKEEFGIERLKEVFANIDSSKDCSDQVKDLTDILFDFTGSDSLDDDLSIILIKRL